MRKTLPGDYDKKEITSYSAWRLRPLCIALAGIILFLLLALLVAGREESTGLWLRKLFFSDAGLLKCCCFLFFAV